jgi:iron complex transport system substrate-binding protein
MGLMVFGFLTVGCGPIRMPLSDNESNGPFSVESTRATDTDAPPSPATTVVDRVGHCVTFEHAPKRIVSLLPSATELMFAIGAGSSIVGATKHCTFPVEAMEIPRVGSGLLEGTSREAILALKPDLILCKWDTHEPLMELFARVHIPVLNLGAESLEELFVEAELLGRVTGHDQEAKALIKHMTDRRDLLIQRVAKLADSQLRSVFYEVWDDPLMTAGPKSFIGELLAMGRMKNLFDDTLVPYPRISSEVVVNRNPDVILAPSSHAKQVDPAKLALRPGWSNINAISKQRVHAIDGDQVSRCGPRMLNALEQMIDAVYPETRLEGANTP